MLVSRKNTHILKKENGIEFYVIEGIKEVQQEMKILLQIVDQVCKKNAIPYWIDGGTMIGAIRHQGFIPWDDDIDISLLKEDYLKLIKELENYSRQTQETYLYFPSGQNIHCCNFFASKKKIYLRSKGIFEVNPIKLDIRPLNCIEDKEEAIVENKKYRERANFLLFHKFYENKDEQLFRLTQRALVRERANFLFFYNNNYGIHVPIEKALFVHPYYEFSGDFYLKYSDIFPLKKVNFEDIEVWVPNKYDTLLKGLYGDYMQLPPLDNRAPVTYEIIRTQRDIRGGQTRSKWDYLKIFGLVKLLKIYFFEK